MSRILMVLFCLCFLAGCGEPRYNFDIKGADEFVMDSYRIRQGKFSILQMQGIPVAPMPPDAMQEYVDTIADDDVLDIALYHPTRDDLVTSVGNIGKSVGYRVIKGDIHLPQIGPIRVRGLTLDLARVKLQQEYDNEIDGVEVFVDYKERLSRVVELTGLVKSDAIPVDGHIRLYDVISRAKVPNNANWFMSYVVRCGKALPVDLYKLIREGDMCQNIIMKPHDKIFIAEPIDSTAMVMGEVGRPTIIALPHGSISLREALVASGGIPFTGDKSCIQVIRGSIVCPKVYRLNWNHIITLPNHSLLLMPGDTVYVAEKPITQWNRFIDQLLPTSAGIRDVGQTYLFVGS
jgi:polysaccharide export outer membrane protein